MTIADEINKAEFMTGVQGLLPIVARNADAAERDRTLPAESAEAFLGAGLARVLGPRRFGGYELELDSWSDIVSTLATVDASHAWCASLIVHHSHYVAQFALEAQEEVWADGPDVAVAASIAPMCKVSAVEGGFRISGRSPWCSGINHSTWAIVGGMLPNTSPPEWTFFLIPKSDYTVEHTWDTIGMRGTGSDTVVTDDVFVPTARALRLSEIREGIAPGGALHKANYYRAPWQSYAPAGFVSPIIGAGQGALQRFTDWTRGRATGSGASVADYTSIQTRLARAAADLDIAEMLVRRALGTADSPTQPDMATRARSLRDFGRAAELGVAAVDSLLLMSGSSAFSESNSIQRVWRDVHLAASHISLNPEMSFAHWGRLALGLERDPKQQMF